MEAPNDMAYHYVKIHLSTPGTSAREPGKPFGTAIVEILDNKGKLLCHTPRCFGYYSEKNPDVRFYGILEKDSEKIPIGTLDVDEKGHGSCEWEFVSSQDALEESVSYKLVIMAERNLNDQGEKATDLFLEGVFSLPFEVWDNKVVGIKKEAKVKQLAHRQDQGIPPLIQKVEPFQPAIPNTVWWQINIQPGYGTEMGTVEYCPRRRKYEALF